MNRLTVAIEWLTQFHEAADGRTRGALDLARPNLAEAPAGVHELVDDEGLRLLLHALRRSSRIQVNGQSDQLPLFVAMEDENGITVHRPRLLVPVSEIARQIERWDQRRTEAAKELSWWTHQRDLAAKADARATDTLRTVWDRLGLSYTLFIGSVDQSAA